MSEEASPLDHGPTLTHHAPPFSRTLYVGWEDVDANGHMKNTSYLAKAVDLRMMYFQEHGFGPAELVRLRLGPVVLRDEVEYFRELVMMDAVRVTLLLAGASADASAFRIRNDLYRPGGEPAATVVSSLRWLDLDRRRLVRPPEPLAAVVLAMSRAEPFEELPPGAR
jgi:acyl-CoA thioester hydrolase